MHDDLSRSVLAVPPLARRPDLRLDRAANAALIGYLERGGISTLMYGGNANLYHVGVSDYAELLDQLLELARPDTWVIPSIGPDFGKMLDQADLLRDRPYPTAMVLPSTAPSTVAGAEAGIARVAERLGRPLIVYLRGETFLDPPAIRRLVERGLVRAVKYGITRAEPRQDPFLRRLIDEVDRRIVVSGMGERPAIVHWQEFGLAGFTSGSVCARSRPATSPGPSGSAAPSCRSRTAATSCIRCGCCTRRCGSPASPTPAPCCRC